MQDSALNRLKSVIGMGDGTLKNHVTGVVEEPVAEHFVDMARVCLESKDVIVSEWLCFARLRRFVELEFKIIFLGRLFTRHGVFYGQESGNLLSEN
jgi:hypothetical protein